MDFFEDSGVSLTLDSQGLSDGSARVELCDIAEPGVPVPFERVPHAAGVPVVRCVVPA